MLNNVSVHTIHWKNKNRCTFFPSLFVKKQIQRKKKGFYFFRLNFLAKWKSCSTHFYFTPHFVLTFLVIIFIKFYVIRFFFFFSYCQIYWTHCFTVSLQNGLGRIITDQNILPSIFLFFQIVKMKKKFVTVFFFFNILFYYRELRVGPKKNNHTHDIRATFSFRVRRSTKFCSVLMHEHQLDQTKFSFGIKKKNCGAHLSM